MPESEIQEVLLFGGAKGPYGDSRINVLRPDSYKNTMHMLSEQGVLVPYFLANEVSTLSSYRGPPVGAIEWENDTGDLIILVAYGVPLATSTSTLIARIDSDGVVTTDKAFSTAVPGRVSPLVLHSDGGTVPYAFMCFGSGTSDKIQYRTTTDGDWTVCAGTPDEADGLFSENGNLWAIVNHQVRKWAAGTNPISATAGGIINVGNAGWNITGVGLLARSYIVMVKPDGIYVYDIDTQRFENIWEGLKENPHPNTGKGTYTWGANLCVPLGWGGMVMITPDLNILPMSPLPPECNGDKTIPGRSRVVAMAGDASHLWATIEPFWRKLGSGEVSLAVRTTANGSDFNDRDSVATDDDLATNFTLDDVSPASANSAIYVKASERFGGLWFDMDSLTSLGDDYGSLEYWDGDSWESVAFTDWASRLVHPGAVIPDAPIPDDWTQNDVNGVTGYWLRLMFTAGSPGSNHQVREVRVLPDPQLLPTGDNVALSGHDEAGFRTHILRGALTSRGMEWDDVASLEGDASRILLFSQLKGIAGAKSLLTAGPRSYTRFQVGYSSRPQAESHPEVQNSFASLWKSRADNRINQNEQAPTTIKGIRYISLYGRHFDVDNDKVQAWIRMDGKTWTFVGKGDQLPTRLYLPAESEPRGFEYEVIVSLIDGARDEDAPQISAIVAGVHSIEGTELEV